MLLYVDIRKSQRVKKGWRRVAGDRVLRKEENQP